jgi:hypothetical protein
MNWTSNCRTYPDQSNANCHIYLDQSIAKRIMWKLKVRAGWVASNVITGILQGAFHTKCLCLKIRNSSQTSCYRFSRTYVADRGVQEVASHFEGISYRIPFLVNA